MKASPTWYMRLHRGETTFDFIGRRKIGFGISILIILAGVGSLVLQRLDLGIDFKGGVAWEVPTDSMTSDEARSVLDENQIESTNAKIQELSGAQSRVLRIQVGDQPQEVRTMVQTALAEKANLATEDVSVSSVSGSWGRSITEKALRALLVFFVLVSLYISVRLEWRMAVAAIVAMVHDLLISVGVYSLFRFEVTPATVVAFLTILGFSLYDTVVVFDRVKENSVRFAAQRMSFANIANVSTNEVLARSLNTTLAAALPVVSLLVVGSGVLGARSLEEFAVALLVGMLAGTYSSIFVAVPLLDVLKQNEPKYRAFRGQIARGEAMATLMGHSSVHRNTGSELGSQSGEQSDQVVQRAKAALTHPPRPRKKRR